MKGYLLDSNLLIALFWPSHERHDLAVKWFTRHRARGWATCPMTQSGFVRIVSNPAFSRDAVQPREAIHVLSANTAAKNQSRHHIKREVGPAAFEALCLPEKSQKMASIATAGTMSSSGNAGGTMWVTG